MSLAELFTTDLTADQFDTLFLSFFAVVVAVFTWRLLTWAAKILL